MRGEAAQDSRPTADAAAEDLRPAPRELELELAAEAAGVLGRLPGVVRVRPPRAIQMVWHDDAEASLRERGQALLREGRVWRLQTLAPGAGCTPSASLAEAAAPCALPDVPFGVAPVAALDGKRAQLALGEVEIALLRGTLRGVFEAVPACRLRLCGEVPGLSDAVLALAVLPVRVPRESLAAAALEAAGLRHSAPEPVPAAIAADLPLTDGLARIIDRQMRALLHWVDAFGREQQPEAVHQGRVAIRRLRSALSLYRRALPGPALGALAMELRACASVLGEARDWDVFLGETAPRLAESALQDRRVAALLRGAARKRREAYAALGRYFASTEFRRVELQLGLAASLRPWEREVRLDVLRQPTVAYAAAALDRRLKSVRGHGRRLARLPIVELHDLRKDCKRLRYAAEFFAPAFKATPKPFLRRLGALQDELGALNDSAVAGQLLLRLGRAGSGYAGGVIEGWAAASGQAARHRIEKAWKRFRSAPHYWA